MLALQRWYPKGVPTWWMLFGEGVLAAIASTDSVERLLQENRRLIYDTQMLPRLANARLFRHFMLLFAGCCVGFSALGLLLPLPEVQSLL